MPFCDRKVFTWPFCGRDTHALGIAVLASGLSLGAGATLAQESTPVLERRTSLDLTDAPVEMHEGTCINPSLDPWSTIGRLEHQGLAELLGGDDSTVLAALTGDDSTGEKTLISEDGNGNGTLDEGEDVNGNGVLDSGVDADNNGILDQNEIIAEGEAANTVVNLPDFYTTQGDITAGFEPLFGQQNVIAVHESSQNYENIVACGNLGGVDYQDEEEIVIGLKAVDGSGIRGYAVFEFDPVLFGNDMTAVTVQLFEGMPTQRESRMNAPQG